MDSMVKGLTDGDGGNAPENFWASTAPAQILLRWFLAVVKVKDAVAYRALLDCKLTLPNVWPAHPFCSTSGEISMLIVFFRRKQASFFAS